MKTIILQKTHLNMARTKKEKKHKVLDAGQ